ncbi:hypothetical protein Tco_0892119 [Tanacetum coccineum]|uniref:Uncharacterized protein n=1 Tax=Tanacetum coccineum TaxID=301880 RepID=A0ABQ5C808_9ASTR
MASMKYCDKHNQVGFLKKPKESTGFAEIVDFLKGSHIRWDSSLELRATIDTLEYTITEASVQSKLQLADASRISMLPNTEIFEGMGNNGARQADQVVDQPSPSEPLPSSSHPPMLSATTESEPTPVAEQITHPTSLTPEPDSEPIKHTFEQPSPENQPLSPRQETEALKILVQCFEEVNTGGLGVSTGSGPVSSARGQREGKAPMIEEETAKQVHLDALLAKRLAEEEELTEQQKKRKTQVQFEAQVYTEEDRDAIRAKLEANAKFTKDVLGKDLSEQDFAKRMVDLVNQRKKHFVEERAKAKRNKPMTQSQLMKLHSNYLKIQRT